MNNNSTSENNNYLRGAPGQARHKNTPKGKRKKVTEDFYGTEITHYFDTKEFKDYCKLVLSVIGETPVSIREIKLMLGDKLNDGWLADALNWIEDELEVTHSVPAKYSRKQ